MADSRYDAVYAAWQKDPEGFWAEAAEAVVEEIRYQVDIDTLHKIEEVESFQLNEIGRIRLRTAVPLLHDAYRRNRQTGSFILIDPGTNETVGAGMIL